MTVFSVNRLTLGNAERFTRDVTTHVPLGQQMHFDPIMIRVPSHLVPEPVDRNIAVTLAGHPFQQVKVEGGRHPLRLVIATNASLPPRISIDHDSEPPL